MKKRGEGLLPAERVYKEESEGLLLIISRKAWLEQKTSFNENLRVFPIQNSYKEHSVKLICLVYYYKYWNWKLVRNYCINQE